MTEAINCQQANKICVLSDTKIEAEKCFAQVHHIFYKLLKVKVNVIFKSKFC